MLFVGTERISALSGLLVIILPRERIRAAAGGELNVNLLQNSQSCQTPVNNSFYSNCIATFSEIRLNRYKYGIK
jgi:hypothetical protein